MRYRCMCLVIHAPDDLRVDEQEATDPGPGEVLVAVGFGGICGSDLHYFHHGGFGTVRAVGPDVTAVKPGDRVAVNPSRPCGTCVHCLEGLFN